MNFDMRTIIKFRSSIYIIVAILLLINLDGTAQTNVITQSESLLIRPERFFTIQTNEGTCMNLDLSPDGKSLVFDLLGNIFTLPIKGGQAVQLTKGMSWDSQPVWSPNGKDIAFISDASGTENIWVMDSDGQNKRPISHETDIGFYFGVEWDPITGYLFGNDKLYHQLGGELMATPPIWGQEARFSPDGRYVYSDLGVLTRYDRQSGDTTKIWKTATTPRKSLLSPDGKWLVYVNLILQGNNRSGGNDLHLVDLKTGKERVLIKNIGHWRVVSLERFVFTPDSKALIIGYGGKIHRIGIPDGRDTIIPFTANVTMELGPLIQEEFRIQNKNTIARYYRSVDVRPDGKELVFSALSKIYRMKLPGGKPKLVADQPMGQFKPTYSPDGKWILYVSWDDNEGGHLWKVPVNGGIPIQITETPGYYNHPVWSMDGKTLLVIKGNPHRSRVRFAMNVHGELQHLSLEGKVLWKYKDSIPMENSISFLKDGSIVFLKEGYNMVRPIYIIRKHQTMEAEEHIGNIPFQAGQKTGPVTVNVSPNGRYVVYGHQNNLYLSPLPMVKAEPFTLGHETKDIPTIILNESTGANDPRWEQDGRKLVWVSDSTVIGIEPQALLRKLMKYRPDDSNNKLLTTMESDTLAILKVLMEPKIGKGVVALKGAKVITMEKDLIHENGTILIENDRIIKVGPTKNIKIPKNAEVIDLTGQVILPGLIDMHGHDGPPSDVLISDWWRFWENLNFGVTTVRDPSISNDGLAYAELIESGRVLGPRLLGGVAISTSRFRIKDNVAAQMLAQSYKSWGGTYLKVHDEFTRKERQLLVLAAKEKNLQIVGHLSTRNYIGKMNLSILLDGFTSVEHIFPVGRFYDDVRQLFLRAGSWYTPTLSLSAYGSFLNRYRSQLHYPPDNGAFEDNIPEDNLGLSSHVGIRNWAEDDSKLLYYANSIRELVENGGKVVGGSHGNYPGFQLHWDFWAMEAGGLAPMEALRTVTLSAAECLGMERDIGSIVEGKLADLVILDGDPILDIKNTALVKFVMKNGIMYEPVSLRQLWPKKEK